MTKLFSTVLEHVDGNTLIQHQKLKKLTRSYSSFENRFINPGPASYPILDSEKSKYFNEKLPINGLSVPKKANQYSFGLAR